MKKVCIAVIAFALASSCLFADTFVLGGGGKVYGVEKREYKGPDKKKWVEVKTAFGTVSFPRKELKKTLKQKGDARTLSLEEVQVTALRGKVESNAGGGEKWMLVSFKPREKSPRKRRNSRKGARTSKSPTTGELIRPGDRVRTAKGAEVDLDVGYGVLHIGPESEVKLRDKKGATVKLLRGRVSARLENLPKNREFRVETSEGAVGASAAVFVVTVGRGVRVAVKEGRVEFQRATVEPGTEILAMGGKREAPQPLTDAGKTLFARLEKAFQVPRIDWAVVPGGVFMMGSVSGNENEKLVHRVKMASFLMSKCEVSNAQYRGFLEWFQATKDRSFDHSKQPKNRGYKPIFWDDEDWNGDEFPVVGVDWYSAFTFARWAGGTLPSEAQWEYACRGGTTTNFSFGDLESKMGFYGWYNKSFGRRTHPVGKKKANNFGLYDMHGNVWEWCLDTYQKSYEGAPADGSAWTESGSRTRVYRGGSWGNFAKDCRSAYRFGGNPLAPLDNLGFRLSKPLW